jgi:DNA-binding response OmpR family regulator
LRILIADSSGEKPGCPIAMARALGWSPQVAETGEQLLGVMSKSQPEAWPDVLILEQHLNDTDAGHLIARLDKQSTRGELPPVIVVANLAPSSTEHEQLMQTADILLVRPLTSSTLSNAVNAAVSKRPEILERVLQSTNFDELHAQWLTGVRVLVVDDSDVNLEVAQSAFWKSRVPSSRPALTVWRPWKKCVTITRNSTSYLWTCRCRSLMVMKPRGASGTNHSFRRYRSLR